MQQMNYDKYFSHLKAVHNALFCSGLEGKRISCISIRAMVHLQKHGLERSVGMSLEGALLRHQWFASMLI